ncbi:ClpP/crotonase [Amylostereum chailletii]|nr:ClpP/crotonase [Amylostereum chailletii]
MSSSSSSAPTPEEPTVLFEENLSTRRFILNRPRKLNALDRPTLELLAPKLEHWSKSDLGRIIVGSSNGRAFSAGGDVAGVVQDAAEDATRPNAISFFQREFGLDYFLAAQSKPYVAVLDGFTMGGGYGLAAPAAFKVATEKTLFAMPETKIGYFPDVGASYFLSRLDGELGTYLALTGTTLAGRAVFELGMATHFISSSRVPILLDRLATLEEPTFGKINRILEDLHHEREPEDPATPLTGEVRTALDSSFSRRTVEEIIVALQKHADTGATPEVVQWAKDTLATLELRSPTSLKVALLAIRKGKSQSLFDAYKMELRIATAYCNGATPDFNTGVTTVILNKDQISRPQWSPGSLKEVNIADLEKKFFQEAPSSQQLTLPEFLQGPHDTPPDPMRYALPTEGVIRKEIVGESKSSSGTALTLDELVERLEQVTDNKHGVREKVREVVARRCELDQGQYLRWK